MAQVPKENQSHYSHISMIQPNKILYGLDFVHAQQNQLLAREQKDLVSSLYKIRQT